MNKIALLGLLLALMAMLVLPAVLRAQDYTFTTNNNALTITKYNGSGGAVTIPDTTNGLPVTSIVSRPALLGNGISGSGSRRFLLLRRGADEA